MRSGSDERIRPVVWIAVAALALGGALVAFHARTGGDESRASSAPPRSAATPTPRASVPASGAPDAASRMPDAPFDRVASERPAPAPVRAEPVGAPRPEPAPEP